LRPWLIWELSHSWMFLYSQWPKQYLVSKFCGLFEQFTCTIWNMVCDLELWVFQSVALVCRFTVVSAWAFLTFMHETLSYFLLPAMHNKLQLVNLRLPRARDSRTLLAGDKNQLLEYVILSHCTFGSSCIFRSSASGVRRSRIVSLYISM